MSILFRFGHFARDCRDGDRYGDRDGGRDRFGGSDRFGGGRYDSDRGGDRGGRGGDSGSRCYKCDRMGHFARECRDGPRGGDDRNGGDRDRCYKCNR